MWCRDLPLGPFGVLLSLGIAMVKSTLVALFFMHFWDERGAIPFAMVVSAALLLLLLGFAVTDVVARRDPMGGAKPGVALGRSRQ